MSFTNSRHPSLYRLAADGRTIELLFAHCGRCDGLSFPATVPGCARCGAPRESLQQISRPASGTLLSCVEIVAPVVPDMKLPQWVAEVEIAPGIVEECLLDTFAAPGSTVIGMPWGDATSGDGMYECRFGSGS